jgi:acyl-CoA thioesterase-2
MGSALADLVRLLELDEIERGRVASRPVDTERRRLYGGQVVAQALMAAGSDLDPTRAPHSLHAYFVKSGDPTAPIAFAVESIRDSGTFSTRRVVARQGERVLLSLEASFQDPEAGYEEVEALPDGPGPDEMVETDDWVLAATVPDQHLDLPYFVDAVETRQLDASLGGPGRPWPAGLREPRRDMWIRARGDLLNWPLLHACVLAYASDKPMLGTTALSPPMRHDPRPHLLASLDHSMWFHRPFRMDEWLLLRLASETPSGARAYTTGELFGPTGGRVARIAQEGLARPLPPSE